MEETRKKKTRTKKRNTSSQARKKPIAKKVTELDEKIKEEKEIKTEKIKKELTEKTAKEPKKKRLPLMSKQKSLMTDKFLNNQMSRSYFILGITKD